MSIPDIHALVGAYALDALDDLERAAFTRHLAECDACSVEVAELRETAARLADGAWSVPPPSLRSAVLAEVNTTRQLPPEQPRPETAVPAAVWRWRRVTAAAAVVAIAAAGAGAASYAVQSERVRDQRAVAAAARADADRMRAILSAPDVALRTGPLAGGGRVTVVMSATQNAGMAMMADAPPPPNGHAYQLWLMDGTNAIPAGVLAAGAGQGARLLPPVKGMKTFGVSIEPTGGSKTPTSDKVVATISLT